MFSRQRFRCYFALLSIAVFFSIVLLIKTYIVTLMERSEMSKYQEKLKNRPFLPANFVYQRQLPLPVQHSPGLEINNEAAPLVTSYLSLPDLETYFYRFLDFKEVFCYDNRRLGNQHDGGWNICLSPPFTVQSDKPCLVYSFGIGEDWRFEDDMYDLFRCQVMAYDPSILLQEHNRTEKIWFKRLGLGAENNVTKEKWRLKTFKQFLQDENHSEHIIDYLKFDIEFMEWDVLQALVSDDSLKYVKQLAFEIHLKHPSKTDAKDLYITKEEFLEKHQILESLGKINFRKFDYRVNPFCGYISNTTHLTHSRCYELHYINLNFVQRQHLKNVRDRRMPLLG